jgi:uncharacterized protein (TIGR02757 family)
MNTHLKKTELREFLEEKYSLYNRTDFITNDPISIPHKFSKKEDIEIAAFLSASIAWGNRKSIITNAEKIIRILNYSPYEFVTNATEKEIKKAINDSNFNYRTFKPTDLLFFISSLKNIYCNYGGLEKVFISNNAGAMQSIIHFRKIFFSITHEIRSEKHVSNPENNSACKKLNMFLRWMIRKDNRGVDFGIWDILNPSQLICPLDVHTGNVARKLRLLERKQNDRKAAEELTDNLRHFDKDDPVKYDFALFGLGVFEKF